jgi:hypothetical protein
MPNNELRQLEQNELNLIYIYRKDLSIRALQHHQVLWANYWVYLSIFASVTITVSHCQSVIGPPYIIYIDYSINIYLYLRLGHSS